MTSVQFGADLYGQLTILNSLFRVFGIRSRHHKITAQTNKNLCLFFVHRFDGLHRIVSFFDRWIKIEVLLDFLVQSFAYVVHDAHGAVPLHIAVPSHGTSPCKGFAHGSFEQ